MWRTLGCLVLFAFAACTSQPDPRVQPPPPPPEAARGRCRQEPALDAALPVWDLYVSRDGWDALHVEVRAQLAVDALLCVDGEPFPLALELQGASTRRLRKKSFDLKFRDRPLDAAPFGEREQLPRILLKAMLADQSLIREALAFELWRVLGHDAPRVGFTNLRINGSDWGLYALVEPVDEELLARLGYPAGGHLYKGVRAEGSRADFRPGRRLRDAFESKIEGPGEWQDLEALVKTLQDTPLTQSAFEREVEPIFPLDRWFDRMLWIAITQNGDAVGQNFYLYNAPRDGHDFWTVLPWDSNLCFGADWTDHYGLIGSDEQPLVDGGNYLGNRLMQIDGLRRRYLARFRQVLSEELTEDAILRAYRPLAERIERDLARDQARWQREVSPARAFEALERFFRERPAVLHAAIEELERKYGDEPGGAEPEDEHTAAMDEPDAGVESEPDAGAEREPDATAEREPDASVESEPDATVESGPDPTVESEPDAGADAGQIE